MTLSTDGKAIRIFLVDGTPQGVLTLEVGNWSGHVLMGPRTQIAELVSRPEAARMGVYFLIGPDPDGSARPCVYVGESDQIRMRLTQHNKDETKDFWERACILTSKDQNLTKAHGKYLESRFLKIIQETGHAIIKNSNLSVYESLPEADRSDMETFIKYVRLSLPVLSLDIMREKPRVKQAAANNSALDKPAATSPVFEIDSRKHGLTATAQEIDGEFIVMAGSQTRDEWGSTAHNYKKLFDALVSEGKIKIDPSAKKGTFTENVAFASPSAASAIVYGRSSNGRTEWKVAGTMQTYADWQNSLLESIQSNLNQS